VLEKSKGALKDAFQLEDFEEEGVVSLKQLKDIFRALQPKLDQELLEYVIYCVYSKSESI